jgi:hypothetical protein
MLFIKGSECFWVLRKDYVCEDEETKEEKIPSFQLGGTIFLCEIS